jgi:hypothetical protein
MALHRRVLQRIDLTGGCTRTRTLDPLIKSQLLTIRIISRGKLSQQFEICSPKIISPYKESAPGACCGRRRGASSAGSAWSGPLFFRLSRNRFLPRGCKYRERSPNDEDSDAASWPEHKALRDRYPRSLRGKARTGVQFIGAQRGLYPQPVTGGWALASNPHDDAGSRVATSSSRRCNPCSLDRLTD